MALEQAVSQRPSAILLDLIMPGMDGWKTLSALKERPKTQHIPIIIFSVLSRDEAEMIPAEVSGWVQQPLIEGMLIDTLDRITSRSSGASTILLVEEDLQLAGLLTNKFRDAGSKTFHAKTGQAAIQASNSILPDLIFLGLALPENDGSAIVEWLRRHDRLGQVPLVIYSVMNLEDSQRERLTLGTAEFLTKQETGPEETARRVANLLMEVAGREPAKEGQNGAQRDSGNSPHW